VPTVEEEKEKEDAKPAVKRPPVMPPDLVMQARAIDAEHRLAHRGKPISRDNLKLALGIATDTATTLIHIIRAQGDVTALGGQQATADVPSAA
jgi:hypothetical protein